MVQLQFTFPIEIWLPIPEWENLYQVSNLGRVRSIRFRNSPGRIRRQIKDCDGYFRVTLHRNKKRKFIPIHQLVAAAFIGKRPPGFEINHRSGIKTENHPENLEFVTPSANRKHAIALELVTFPLGEKHHNSKLTEADVREIRRLTRTGISQREIAKMFGVHQQTISKIHTRRLWVHLT